MERGWLEGPAPAPKQLEADMLRELETLARERTGKTFPLNGSFDGVPALIARRREG